jgi:hypothetical protein
MTHIYSGSVGVSPGTSITGSFQMYDGIVEVQSAASKQCTLDLGIAYRKAATITCGVILANPDLSGITFTPDVYCSQHMLVVTSAEVTLDALGDESGQWVFQTESTLVTGTFSKFILTSGAQSDHVYRAIGSSTTIGGYSSFVGNMLAAKSITLNSFSALTGRALAMAATTCESGCSIALQPSQLSYSRIPSGQPSGQPSSQPTNPTDQPRYCNKLLCYSRYTSV